MIFLQNRVRRRLLGTFENFRYLGSDGCVFFGKIDGGSADQLIANRKVAKLSRMLLLHSSLHYHMFIILFLSFCSYVYIFSSSLLLLSWAFSLPVNICFGLFLSFFASFFHRYFPSLFIYGVIHLRNFSFPILHTYSCSAVESSPELDSLDSQFVDYLTTMRCVLIIPFLHN